MTLTERIAAYAANNPVGAPPSTKPRPVVITVRLSQTMHQQLRSLAYDQKTSLNGLCVASLQHAVETLAPTPEVTSETPPN
jgi:predicted HicB family RNase H-like nuclease